MSTWEVWFGLEEFDYYSRNEGRFVSEYGLQSLQTFTRYGKQAFHHLTTLRFNSGNEAIWIGCNLGSMDGT